MRPVFRVVVVLMLLFVLGGMLIHHGAAYDAAWPYPPSEEVAADPATYDGEYVLFIGEVESVDADTQSIVYRPDDDLAWTLKVTNFEHTVEPRGTVQVYGPLVEGGTIQQAESVVIVNEHPAAQRNKLLISLLGGLLAAGLFLRHWRIEWRRLQFRRRSRDG